MEQRSKVSATKSKMGLWPEVPQPLGMNAGAGNGIRTRDPNLGKVVLYQLSYSRIGPSTYQSNIEIVNEKADLTESVR